MKTMMKTRNKTLFIEYKKIFAVLSVIIFFAFILFFIYSRTSHIWRGIHLAIISPESGDHVDGSLLYIEGVANKAIKLTINGDNTFVEETGGFSYPLVVHSGYNNIYIEATDKFGNISKKSIQIHGSTKPPDIENLERRNLETKKRDSFINRSTF